MRRSRGFSTGFYLPILALQALNGATASAQTADATTTGSNASANIPAGGLEEIVVTAARREQNESKVPISITAFTQKALDENNVRTVDDIMKLTPGVQFDRSGDREGIASISIRGVQSDAGSGATGIYIDDTPIQSRADIGGLGSSVWPQIFNLERVEVLRGPQGTLFGAGSEGGTVRFITPQPSTTQYQVYARSELSFTQDGAPSQELGVAGNVPVVDGTLGVRASAYYRHDGGYVNRVDYISGNVEQPNSNFQDTKSLRLALIYKPADALTITPAFYYQSLDFNDSGLFWDPLSNVSAGDFNRSSNIRNSLTDKFSLPSLKVEWALPGATFISNSSYFDRTQTSVDDLAYFEAYIWAQSPYYPAGMYAPSYYGVHQKIYTQEFRLQSQDPDARVNWVAGVFYQHNWQNFIQEVQDTFLPGLFKAATGGDFNAIFGSLYQNLYTVYVNPFITVDKQTAAFGQVDLKITDKLKGTVGLRVSKTDLSTDILYAGPITGGLFTRTTASAEKPVTPKFGLSYQATENTMVYTSVSKGYRPGGGNNPVSINCDTDLGHIGLKNSPATYASDSLWSYEIGGKSRTQDNRFAVDGSVYVIKWKNIQFNYVLPTCNFPFTTNAGNATSKGVELTLRARPVDSLDLGFSFGYTNASYDNTQYFGGQKLFAAEASITGAGDRLLVSPWTASLFGQWKFVALEHDSYFRVNFNHSAALNHGLASQDPNNGSYDPTTIGLPALNDLDLRLGTHLGPVDAALFVNNTTNQHPILTRSHAAPGDPLFMSSTVRPRTIGVNASYRF